jgi:hypothetical protein
MSTVPPTRVAGHRQHDHRGALPEAADEQRGQQRPAEGTGEEDVEGAQRGADAAQPVGHDLLQQRPDHGEGGRRGHGGGDAGDGEEHRVGHVELDRDHHRAGQDQPAHQRQGLGGVLAVEAVEVPAGEGQHGHHADPDGEGDQAPAEGVEAELVLQEEVRQGLAGEQDEPEGRERHDDRAHGPDLPDAGEAGLHGDGDVRVLDDLGEHVALLPLAPHRLAHA